MAETSSSIAQQFTGLPMSDLIGGPLMAVSEANGNMAKKQTQFLFDTCFKASKDNDSVEPIMIKLNMTRAVLSFSDDGTTPSTSYFTTTIDLPLLTVIPLNNLGVDSASVNFEMEVKSANSEDIKETSKSSTEAKASITGKAGWGPFSVSISGNVSYSSEDSRTHDTHYENSNTAKYSVSVHAGQLPMPRGVNTIIDAYSKSIQPVQNSIVKQSGGKAE